MTEIGINLSKLNGTQDDAYKQEVNRLIRRRYSLSDELALGRQRDEKPEEWEAFYAYCEQCKAEAKKEVYDEKAIL